MIMYRYLSRILLSSLALVLTACSSGNDDIASATCSIASVPVLSVIDVAPATFDSGIATNQQISVNFNNCLNINTINGNSFYITGSDSNTKISGQIRYNTDTRKSAPNVIIFQPTTPFMPMNKTMTVTVTTAVKGFNGEPMFLDFVSTFSTGAEADTNPPITTSTIPAGFYNATQNVGLVCDDTIDTVGNSVPGAGCDKTYYTLDGTTPTILSKKYNQATIEVGGAAPDNQITEISLRYFSTDLADNVEAVVEQVYVMDKVKPTLQSVTLENATEVPVDSVITATFDEDMLATSFTPSTIIIDNGVTASYSFDNSTQTLTITPNERLICNTLHTVSLETGLSDLAGNNLTANKSWSFTTTTDCTEPVSVADIVGGVYKTTQNVLLTCSDVGSSCSRLVYTTDGTIPSFSPTNGTIVNTVMTGPIAIGEGNTLLRYYSEDSAGHREVLREQLYTISTTGLTFAATQNGLARGVGSEPMSYINMNSAGTTNTFFVDRSNNRIYRGTVKGLYYSDNEGSTWRSLGQLNRVNAVFATGSKIMAATTVGLWTSLDGGATFARETFKNEFIVDVVISGRYVLVARSLGLSISTDKGVNFTTRTTDHGLGSNNVYDVEIDDTTIYAATSAGLSISTTLDGNIFVNHNPVDNTNTEYKVRVVKVDSANIYAGTESGLYIATKADNSTYAPVADLLNAYIVSLHVDANNVFVGMGDPCCSSPNPAFAVSVDGGARFTNKRVAPVSAGQNVASASFAVVNGTLYVGAFPSYYTSTDSGNTFTMGGIPFDEFNAVVGDGTRLYASASNGSGFGGVLISDDDGTTFTLSSVAQGLPAVRIDDLFIDGSTLYTASSSPIGGLSVSNDGGQSFVTFTTDNGLFSNSPSTVFAAGATIYAGTGSTLDLSTNNGAMFSQLFTTNFLAKDIVVSASNIYLATTNGVYVSSDSGVTAPLLKTVADGLAENSTKSVTVASNGQVFVGTLNTGISTSTDGGTSFGPVEGLTTGGVNALHEFGTILYAATTNGVTTLSPMEVGFNVKITTMGLGSDVVTDIFYSPN